MENSMEGTSAERSPLLAASQSGLAVQLIVQLLIGLVLSSRFAADPAHAYTDTSAMHHDAFLGFLQAMHYWGSAVFIVHAALHLFVATWTGAYGKSERIAYLGAILFFLCSVGFQLTGNVLPFDRHGVQTANVEAGIAARAPVVGKQVADLLMGGPSFSDSTPERWYLLHRVVLPVLALLTLALWFRARRGTRWNWAAIAPAAITAILAVTLKSPLGSAASALDYEQASATVSWYMWPLHGTMHMFEKLGTSLGWIGAILVPGVLVAFFFALALFGDRVSTKVSRSVLGLGLLIIAVGTIGFGGGFAPLTGNRDPREVATTGGPIRPIDQALAQKGRDAFNNNQCAGCHGKDGATGGGGPVLTRIWQRHSDADYFIRYIRNPASISPSSTMPAFPDLPQADVEAMAEFLRSKK